MKSEYAKDGTRLRDKDYLAWIRTQPCFLCRCPAEPAHGRPWGKGMKGPDYEAIPLCRQCHENEHRAKIMLESDKRDLLVDKYNFKYCTEKEILIKDLRQAEK